MVKFLIKMRKVVNDKQLLTGSGLIYRVQVNVGELFLMQLVF